MARPPRRVSLSALLVLAASRLGGSSQADRYRSPRCPAGDHDGGHLPGVGAGRHARVVRPLPRTSSRSPPGTKARRPIGRSGSPSTAGPRIGVYPVRIVTDSGVSNPILFAVGRVPQMLEVEPNNTFEVAQPIPSPVVVEGECSGNDVDFFRFAGPQGGSNRRRCGLLADRVGSGPDDPADDRRSAARGLRGRYPGPVHRRVPHGGPARGRGVCPRILRFAVRGHGAGRSIAC